MNPARKQTLIAITAIAFFSRLLAPRKGRFCSAACAGAAVTPSATPRPAAGAGQLQNARPRLPLQARDSRMQRPAHRMPTSLSPRSGMPISSYDEESSLRPDGRWKLQADSASCGIS